MDENQKRALYEVLTEIQKRLDADKDIVEDTRLARLLQTLYYKLGLD